jgi:hypothetical protein
MHIAPLTVAALVLGLAGEDNGDPVSPSYATQSPFPFTGRIGKVVFDVVP